MTIFAFNPDTYTRTDFVSDILYSMSEDDIIRLFGVNSGELERGAWNGNLEIAYSQVID